MHSDDPNNSQEAVESQPNYLGGLQPFSSHNPAAMFRSPPLAGQGGVSITMGMFSNPQNQPQGFDGGAVDLNAELKRYQQLQQFQQQSVANPNALLNIGGSSNSAQPRMSESSTLHNSNSGNSPRLEGISMPAAMGGGFQPGFLTDTQRFLLQNTQNPTIPQTTTTSAALGAPLPSPSSLFDRDGSRRMRGGVIEPFPEKLHRLLLEVEAAGRSDVISFIAGGRAFAIHKPDKFFKEIVPLYFRQSRLSSFKRQLNLYGFELINTGPARGGYYHELFRKDAPEMCRRMRRVAIKSPNAAKKDVMPTAPTTEVTIPEQVHAKVEAPEPSPVGQEVEDQHQV